MTNRGQQIADKFNHFKENLPAEVQLIAVSKYSPFEDIKSAYESGHRHFAENRVDSLWEKSLQAKKEGLEICWHFIGHLQKNKINKLGEVGRLVAIHSIDSMELLKALIKREDRFARSIKLFFEVNTWGEKEKNGVETLEEIQSMKNFLRGKDKFSLEGLMTMGTMRTDNKEEEARRCFSLLASLRDKLDSQLKLSMGMSSDYQIAIEEGSTSIRIGSLLFK